MPLLEVKKPKKNYDYLALTAITFIKLGSIVELSLPAVVSQPISCEMGLTKTQEHILALALYFTILVTNVVSSKVTANRPRKTCILSGLYITAAILIFCAIVPNYSSLLASRILLGICDSIKYSPPLVYIAEIASTESFYEISILVSTFFYTVGGAWCGIVGYFFMDLVGWRYFFLISSLPLFIPPLILFQFYLPETYIPESEDIEKKQLDFDISHPKKDMICRIVSITSFVFCFSVYFFGATLLVPSIARYYNHEHKTNSLCDAIHGTQFLILGVMFGVCHLIGNIFWYIFVKLKIPNSVLLIGSSVLNTATLGTACLLLHNVTIVYIGIGITQVVAMILNQETLVMASNRKYFISKYLTISVSLLFGDFTAACLVVNILAELLMYTTVVKTYIGVSIIGLIISFTFSS